MKRTTIIEMIVMLYSILFLYTAFSKLIDYSIFKEQIAASPILAPISKVIAGGLPIIEILITVMLIIPRWRFKGLFASLCLMTLFTIYIIATLAFSEHIPCSCGGIISALSWKQHIIFNTIFISFSIIGIVLTKREVAKYNHEWPSSASKEYQINPKNI